MFDGLPFPESPAFSTDPADAQERENPAPETLADQYLNNPKWHPKAHFNSQALSFGDANLRFHDGSFSKDWNLYPISSHLVRSSSRISAFVFEVL